MAPVGAPVLVSLAMPILSPVGALEWVSDADEVSSADEEEAEAGVICIMPPVCLVG